MRCPREKHPFQTRDRTGWKKQRGAEQGDGLYCCANAAVSFRKKQRRGACEWVNQLFTMCDVNFDCTYMCVSNSKKEDCDCRMRILRCHWKPLIPPSFHMHIFLFDFSQGRLIVSRTLSCFFVLRSHLPYGRHCAVLCDMSPASKSWLCVLSGCPGTCVRSLPLIPEIWCHVGSSAAVYRGMMALE